MRKTVFALVLLLSFVGCSRNQNEKQPASDLRFCGRWMKDKYSPVVYRFKPDGSFSDVSFASMPYANKLPKGVSWRVKGNILYLSYDFHRTLFYFFKIPTQFTLKDTIKQITDSTLVLATRSIKKVASDTISLIKMKEGGKYTTE
jgi:hypothetical protein